MFGPFIGYVLVMFGSCSGHVWIIFQSSWAHVWVILGSFLDRLLSFGDHLFLSHFASLSESFWSHLGTDPDEDDDDGSGGGGTPPTLPSGQTPRP